MKGCGAIVRCFTGVANISAGASLIPADGGSVTPSNPGTTNVDLLIGTAVTAQATQSGTIDVLLNY